MTAQKKLIEHPYISISYVNVDVSAAENLFARLTSNGFACRMCNEFMPLSERTDIVGNAQMHIALTSRAAALGTSVASDIRHAKALGTDVLCVSLEDCELDRTFTSSGDTGISAVPFPGGEFPDKQSVALFIHRAFVQNICKHYACFSPENCATDAEGKLITSAVLAWRGDAKSCYTLGMSYTDKSSGRVVPIMDSEAAHWIGIAAEKGVVDALIRMGQLRLDGRGTERDYHEAYRLFTVAASKGDARGTYYMGICTQSGFGIMRDAEMAVRYFYTSAVKGYAPAAYRLALLYRDGVGIEASWKRAVAWLWRAAECDAHPIPGRHGYRKKLRYKCVSMRHMRQSKIGDLLYGSRKNGVSLHWENNALFALRVKKSFTRSTYKEVHCEAVLANRIPVQKDMIDTARYNRGKGYSEMIWDPSMAAGELGRLLASGSKADGILPDGRAALYWYRVAMSGNHSDSYIYTAACYKRGFGVLPNMECAFRLYEKAAMLGNERAEYNLGVCYENGEGVKKDLSEAVRWYEPAAYAGYAPAQNNLGGCYESGSGVEMNMLLAVDWYTRASAQGQPDATVRLGLCHENGNGVVQDITRAIELYREAARKNHPFALYKLGVCYDRGIGMPQQFARAAKLYERAAQGGLAQAKYAMGLCTRSGRGVFRDDKLSFEYFKDAADAGCVQACFETGLCYLEGKTAVANPKKAIKYLNMAVKLYDTMKEDLSLCREDATPPAGAMTVSQAAAEAMCILAYCKLYAIGNVKTVQATADSGSADARAESAFAMYINAAEAGSPAAMSAIGDFYRLGVTASSKGHDRKQKALKYYMGAAEVGSAYATYRLALYDIEEAEASTDPIYSSEKYLSAWERFTYCSNHGNPDALLALAKCTALGNGTPQNPYRAVSLLERAIKNGASSEAMLLLGDAYLYGRGAKKNASLAISCYSNIAQHERRVLWVDKYSIHDVPAELYERDRIADAEALYRLAVYYAENETIKADEPSENKKKKKVYSLRREDTKSKSLHYLSIAILAGHKTALDDMARMLTHDITRFEYYKELSPAPDVMSVVMKPRGFDADGMSEAVQKITCEVTEKMRADALAHLGNCYLYGNEVEVDPQTAVKFYRVASQMGQLDATYNLGRCLLNAYGTERNTSLAVACFTKCEKQHADAEYCLAKCYENGVGVSDADVREALKHYRRAAKMGHKNALIRVRTIEKMLRREAE